MTKVKVKKIETLIFYIVSIFIYFAFDPTDSYDIKRHYEYFETLDFEYLRILFNNIFFLTGDILFYAGMFLAKKIGVPSQTYFLVIFILNISVLYYIFQSNTKNFIKKTQPYYILFILSISLMGVLSGVRFSLAIAIFLLGHFMINLNKKHYGRFFFILSFFTHFSMAFFITIYYLSNKVSLRGINYFIFTLLLIIFYFVLLCSLYFFENNKAEFYLGELSLGHRHPLVYVIKYSLLVLFLLPSVFVDNHTSNFSTALAIIGCCSIFFPDFVDRIIIFLMFLTGVNSSQIKNKTILISGIFLFCQYRVLEIYENVQVFSFPI